MIERLMDEEFQYGEPAFSKAGEQIEDMRQKLNRMLDAEGRALLDSMADAYIHQNNLIQRDVFRAGFCAAVELMLDFLRRRGR